MRLSTQKPMQINPHSRKAVEESSALNDNWERRKYRSHQVLSAAVMIQALCALILS